MVIGALIVWLILGGFAYKYIELEKPEVGFGLAFLVCSLGSPLVVGEVLYFLASRGIDQRVIRDTKCLEK